MYTYFIILYMLKLHSPWKFHEFLDDSVGMSSPLDPLVQETWLHFVFWPRHKEWSPALNKTSYTISYSEYSVQPASIQPNKVLLLHPCARVAES